MPSRLLGAIMHLSSSITLKPDRKRTWPACSGSWPGQTTGRGGLPLLLRGESKGKATLLPKTEETICSSPFNCQSRRRLVGKHAQRGTDYPRATHYPPSKASRAQEYKQQK